MPPLGVMATRSLAALFHPHKNLVFDLQVPGEVIFAGLQHRACCRDSIAAALHLDGVEVRPVGFVIVHVDLARDEIAWLEVLELVGAGADRLEVGRRVARLGTDIVAEQMAGDDAAGPADESVGPERRRLLELHDHGVLVDLLDNNILVGTAADGRRRGIAGIFPGEEDVVGREGLAVVPGHTLLHFPDDRLSVGGERAVLAVGDRGGELRAQVAVAVPCGQRFVEQAAGILVLGADGEVRVEQGRALPPHDLQQAAAASFGWLVNRPGLRHGDARKCQELGRHRRREPHCRHPSHEGATGHTARLHLVDQTTQATFVHWMPPSGCQSRSPDAPAILQDACKPMGTAATAAVNVVLINPAVCAIPAHPWPSTGGVRGGPNPAPST